MTATVATGCDSQPLGGRGISSGSVPSGSSPGCRRWRRRPWRAGSARRASRSTSPSSSTAYAPRARASVRSSMSCFSDRPSRVNDPSGVSEPAFDESVADARPLGIVVVPSSRRASPASRCRRRLGTRSTPGRSAGRDGSRATWPSPRCFGAGWRRATAPSMDSVGWTRSPRWWRTATARRAVRSAAALVGRGDGGLLDGCLVHRRGRRLDEGRRLSLVSRCPPRGDGWRGDGPGVPVTPWPPGVGRSRSSAPSTMPGADATERCGSSGESSRSRTPGAGTRRRRAP